MATIFDTTMGVLSKSMDMYLVRHSIISDNIANAETPGYKARRLNFESALQAASREYKDGVRSRAQHMGAIQNLRPHVYEDANAEVGQDRNSVDMDLEMAQLTKNDMKYNAATKAIAKKFSFLKYAITEGRGR